MNIAKWGKLWNNVNGDPRRFRRAVRVVLEEGRKTGTGTPQDRLHEALLR